ncbi:hypothetical protein [Limosilactobacillus fermentum]|uniref:Uncharacterized protein n=1 Tax=Limosilactobacillus fermentum TaxID=1613 RepID=A0AAJ6D0C7_LIMFE|nr:hypothetical protein [Limosilactobacillus fermentum]MED7635130.1 hypothetical protein [Limosilactobacillus fermentum]PTS38899.1 hypothetical protein DBQ14_04415 [Limosilactobacillus fermentum]UVF14496.1 hypothetical protein NHG87_004955 [Limosilactobacillus fermentum]WFR88388.1 hypothetical protein P8634_06025 [Limosilactobacillus fermentum]SNX31667.1 hypothetical protein LF130101_1154 [Limosilactobacillus fermentum]
MRLKDTITPEMKLGRPEFENTVFMLNNPVNALNLDHFAFQGNLLPEPIDEVAYAMPAYLADDYNLFFVFAPNMRERWSITFSQVQIENGTDVVAMSNVVPIGTGLNAVNQLSASAAIELIAYLKTLEVNHLGYFDEEIWKKM